MQKPTIAYPDFDKLDMRIGTIVGCEAIEGSEKLLNLTVDLGSELGKRTILSGIKKYFDPEKLIVPKKPDPAMAGNIKKTTGVSPGILIGTQVLVLVNLEPKKMMGLESQGMILMAVENGVEGLEKISLLVPQDKITDGTGVE